MTLMLLRQQSSVKGFHVAPSTTRRVHRPLSPPISDYYARTIPLSVWSISSEVDPNTRKRRLALWMAYLTGLSDVALSLQFQTFASMMTGNLMWLSRAVMERNTQTMLYYVSVFASYMTGLSLVRLMRNREPRTILRRTGAAVVALFVGADVLFYGAGFSRWIPVCMLAAAYGGINSMGTDFAGTLTFVVTGHVTRLTHLVTDLLVEQKPLKQLTEPEVLAAKQCLAVSGGFFAGALTAFYLLSRNLLLRQGFFSTLGMGYGLLFFSYDGRRIQRWWKRRQVPDMMIAPPTIEVVRATDALEEKDAVKGAVINAVAEEKDVVVIVVNDNSTLPLERAENSTQPVANKEQ